MSRFDPFAKKSGRYGAPMGRHGHNADSWNGFGALYVRHCGGDGYYDRGGVYWGHSNVYAVWTRGGGFCAYVEARDAFQAVAIVRGHTMPEGYRVDDAGTVLCGRFVPRWRVFPPRGEPLLVYGAFHKAIEAADAHAEESAKAAA